jgi:hypothetical protein
MAGAGSSWAAKKEANTAAIVAATAPSGQAVKIQKVQHRDQLLDPQQGAVDEEVVPGRRLGGGLSEEIGAAAP